MTDLPRKIVAEIIEADEWHGIALTSASRRADAILAALVASGWRPEALTVVDVAEHAREMFGDAADYIAGRKLPEHDYRFEATTAIGGHVTFHMDATAGHVATYLKEREHERAAALEPAQPLPVADGSEAHCATGSCRGNPVTVLGGEFRCARCAEVILARSGSRG